ncbi:MAG: flavodoxin-dependent (E)-4-hydroxy-3-methylbut-2-enyl-diphosphate synthase [Defluviitaleaceae bacterium]|nr:flavodoxin-dependent (E)-4-hydroxy-3-methylbut-2-enyl-diphosphate synthase [Defluviitaleaceae bacterium]
MYNRKSTRTVHVGSVPIGGGNPITVQSMTNTDTADIAATITQIKHLEEAGCEIIRVSVPNAAAAEALPYIRRDIKIPIAADIHFDWRLAIASLRAGADKLRLNPGNIGDRDRVKEIAKMCKERGVPIRIGVNGGSLEKHFLGHNIDISEAMAESALDHIKTLEELDFFDIIVSMKSSSVPKTIRAHEILAGKTDYPHHIGITEAGTVYAGGVKSAAGIASLLSRGIGDTIRCSLSGDPVEEVRLGKEILKSMELRRFGAEIIACPTCARTSIDIVTLATRLEDALATSKSPIKVSIMGCVVNGFGEAAHADIGVTAAGGKAILHFQGKELKTVEETEAFGEVIKLIQNLSH